MVIKQKSTLNQSSMSSTVIHWLLVGPLIAMPMAYAVWTFTRWDPAKWAAIACLGWSATFVLIAFLMNLNWSRQKALQKKDRDT